MCGSFTPTSPSHVLQDSPETLTSTDTQTNEQTNKQTNKQPTNQPQTSKRHMQTVNGCCVGAATTGLHLPVPSKSGTNFAASQRATGFGKRHAFLKMPAKTKENHLKGFRLRVGATTIHIDLWGLFCSSARRGVYARAKPKHVSVEGETFIRPACGHQC